MPTVTVPKIVRPGAGYATIAARWGVTPTSITATTVTFPDPDEGAEPLDLALVAEWLRTRDDAEMAQRLAIKSAFIAIQTQEPLGENPTLEQRVEWLEERDARWLAIVAPLAHLFGMAPGGGA